MSSGPVIVRFKPVSEYWCPSSTQDFVLMLSRLVYAHVQSDDELVRVEFGNFQPGFCPETCAEFIEMLNQISRGYVVSTGQTVSVQFGDVECCWNDPQLFIDNLQNAVSATVV